MAVFFVGGVNRLVNLVDDRDLCLLHRVKYDSYLITGFIVQSAHFPNQVIFIRYRFLFLRRSLFQVNFYRFYSSEFNR